MPNPPLRRKAALLFTVGLFLGTAAARGDDNGSSGDFPDRPIRVIVSMPAGGGVDTATRLVTEGMRRELGQPLAVENKPGAAGGVAAETVYHSAADGYTLLASQPSTVTTNPFLFKSLNYDPGKLIPIAVMSHIPNVLLVRPDFPAQTVAQLVAYARANPGKLNYASQGIGTTSHLTAALFATVTGTTLVHVPYKGTAPALNDLMAGSVDMMFTELATSRELHKAGKARILAVATKTRVAGLPDIPTLDESGVQGCESDTWNALTAPPQTPSSVIARLNQSANKAMASAALVDRYQELGMIPGGGTTTAMSAFLAEETRRWGAVIRAAGIEPQ